MLLTIGMIVKNEEKYLERCLSAIKPILDNVDSELIITDTGSTDSTVEIAKKYTDNVLHFDWINDFAAARNYGLEKAHGEWFMFLDGDEIFESCNEIIKFFRSGEYKNYNSASYIQKNIANDNSSGMEVSVPRLTKLQKYTSFMGIIHEVLNTYGEPIKYFRDKVIHYGYYYETAGARRAKYERNRELLLKKLETANGSDPYLYVQLADNALMDAESLEYLDEGIALINDKNTDTYAALMLFKAYIYYRQKSYREAFDVCAQYYNIGCKCRHRAFADIEMSAIKASSAYKLKQYTDAYNTFASLFENYSKADITKITDVNIIMLRTASAQNYLPLAIQFLGSGERIGQRNDVLRRISSLPVYRYSFDIAALNEFVSAVILAMEKSDYGFVEECFSNLNDTGKKLFLDVLNKTVYYSDKKSQITGFFTKVKKEFPKADIIDNYLSGKDIPEYVLYNYAGKYGLDENSDLIMIAMDRQLDISPFIDCEKYDVQKAVSEGYERFYGFNKAADNYDVSRIGSAALLNAVRFFGYCIHASENYKSPKPGVFFVIDNTYLVEKFGMIGTRIAEEISPECEDPAVLAAMQFSKAAVLRKTKNYKECIAELKKAVHIYKPIANAAAKYSDIVMAEYNDEVHAKNSKINEMEMFAATIKKNIRTYIRSGNIEAAQKTLEEYRNIMPKDPEIGDIEAEINSKK